MSKFVLFMYHFCYFLYSKKIPMLPQLLNKIFVRLLMSCQIGLGAKIGKNVVLAYGGLGVIIHHDASVGDNCTIGAHVTIGGVAKNPKAPVIREGCIIATGAKILGPVTVDKNTVVGANAVVVNSLPANCVAVGIPAKIIKTNIDINDYL